MKIIVISDDGKKTVEVATADIDFAGHTLNRAVLEWRVARAVREIHKYENQTNPAPVQSTQA